MLVGQDEPARVGQTFDAVNRGNAPKCRQDHRIAERQVMAGFDRAVLGHFLDMHRACLDLGDPGVGDPLDVAVAQFTF